jgi:hypothetical protein
LWETLRKQLKESFKLELEFFDYSRQEVSTNFESQAFASFKDRLSSYNSFSEFLNLQSEGEQRLMEKELRLQRLLESFCEVMEQLDSV